MALGRKYYFFAGSLCSQGNHHIKSFPGSSKINDVNPLAWLKDVLTRLPDHRPNRLYESLPNSWKSSE
jgi:transposase